MSAKIRQHPRRWPIRPHLLPMPRDDVIRLLCMPVSQRDKYVIPFEEMLNVVHVWERAPGGRFVSISWDEAAAAGVEGEA